jgi:hypothetical protein
MSGTGNHPKSVRFLSELLLSGTERASRTAATVNSQDWGAIWDLANSHHVIMRSFPPLQQLMVAQGNAKWANWAAKAVEKERARIHHALSFLAPISCALQQCGEVVVIKSLDHWPDFGSDLDLYINAPAAEVAAVLRRDFKAEIAKRSWGDRLASKWNFIVPGLPELVEIHVGRLGQTGEQTTITESLLARAQDIQLGGCTFRVPAAEDRMMIATLQRMYRHFYIRLCDIMDIAQLVEKGAVDYLYLRTLARSAGLWEGVATYLSIASDYVKHYRGEGLALPSCLTSAARFGDGQVRFKQNWLRIPIVPHSLRLYAAELRNLLLRGEIRNTLRLTLLPYLAAAAALGRKISGSDKGIW